MSPIEEAARKAYRADLLTTPPFNEPGSEKVLDAAVDAGWRSFVKEPSRSSPTPQEQPDGHTKGPWEAAPDYEFGPIVCNPYGEIVADYTTWPGNRLAEAKANCRMIAAAPDMAEALIAMIEHFERVDGDERHKAVIAQATAAFARAKEQAS